MADNILRVESVVKRFERKLAVDSVSFEVRPGEIMGFLGPNGAGKTTTIRMIMGITAPDTGEISFYLPGYTGQSIPKHRVGYLPEERGLYKEARVMDVLLFLSSLKGVERSEAKKRALHWLERFDLADYANAKVNELSKGMAQKVQFITAVLHEPDLIVLDEPFSGLDPVNQDVFRREIRRLAENGSAILLSSHQMNLVEQTCDRIFLIHEGKRVLYGSLWDIKLEYGVHRITLYVRDTTWQFPESPFVEQVEQEGNRWTCLLRPDVTPAQFMHTLQENAPIEEFHAARISLHDIFVRKATGGR